VAEFLLVCVERQECHRLVSHVQANVQCQINVIKLGLTLGT
jgi:hypothetical protein